MIVSSGYNIAGPEVEAALLGHAAVAECGVVGAPDEARGMIVKAYVVLAAGVDGDAALATELQDHVKRAIAPYKYPRAIEFVAQLPKTGTGKLQRFALRQMAQAGRALRPPAWPPNDASDGELFVSTPKAPTLAVLPTTRARRRRRPADFAAGRLAGAEGLCQRHGGRRPPRGDRRRDRLGQSGRSAERFCRAGPADPEQHLGHSRRRRGGPEHLVRLTWYVVDIEEYLANLKLLGQAYREIFGAHYPAMALVQVVRLVEKAARVESRPPQWCRGERIFA